MKKPIHSFVTLPFLLISVLAADAQPEFKPIFNGKDLSGWDGNPKLWAVHDGAIVGKTTPENPAKGNTFLIWTNGEVSDFELRCSFKISANNDQGFANSGIQYRSKILDPKNWVVGGYQADMEAGPTYTGILYEERMTRGIMAGRGEKVLWGKDCEKKVTGSLGKSEELQAALKKGDWNEYTIIAKGNHLQHFINGKQTVDVIDECESKQAKSGVLALQLHAGQPMTVEFRDLRIKQLSGKESASADDIKQLQGSWRVTSGEANGDSIASENLNNIVVKIDGNKYEVSGVDGDNRGTLTLDPAKQPKQMDIHPSAGEDQGSILKAIYEVGPDTMRVCYAREGANRPSSFATADDSRLLLLNYKREK
jgi:uncharacterized protein (TIGR03067 family)